MATRKARILILCKTYPSPSARHAETSCVAGVEEAGRMIRLYPVPFRLLEEAKFKKWQWISAVVEKASDDHRPESHRIKVDTIQLDGEPLSPRQNWAERRHILDRLPVFDDFGALELSRQTVGTTLGLIRPARITGLDVTQTKAPDWTDEECRKLLQLQRQGNLFDESDTAKIATLRKVPFDFHYRYECDTEAGKNNYRHKIVDWEAGALYWNVRRRNGSSWEAAFRSKLEHELPNTDFMLLMGTIHRFPDQWLIISLIYPPKRPSAPHQGSLLL